MRRTSRRRIALFIALFVAIAAAAIPASAAAPAVVTITPSDGATVQGFGLQIDVLFNQCVNPSSSITVADAVGTLLQGYVSVTSCAGLRFTPNGGLGAGAFFVSVYASSGSGSSTTSTSFVVDNTPPGPPAACVITQVININNKTQVFVSGTGEAGSLATIVIDDTNGGTPAVVCGSSGQANCPVVPGNGHFNAGPFNVTGLDDSPPPSSAPTTLSITATVTLTDMAMNVSDPCYASAYKDTIVPTAPTLDYPASGDLNGNNRWTVSGYATNEAGFRDIGIDVIDNNVAIDSGRAVCAPNGGCAYAKTVYLVNSGSHALRVRAVDAAGNPSPLSNTRTVTVLASTSSGPYRPSIDYSPYPERDAVSVSGVARPGAAMSIDVGGGGPVSCGTAAANVSSPPNYSCGPFDTTAFYGGGSGFFSIKVSDPVTTDDSQTVIAVKDAEAPAAPWVQFSNGGAWVNAAQSSAVLLSGTGEPRAKINLNVSSSGGGISVSAVATVNAFGNWAAVVNLSTPLINDGVLCADAVAVDSVGNTSPVTTACPGPTLDRIAPPPPVITSPAEGATVNFSTFPVQGTAGGGAATVEIFEGAPRIASGTAAAFTGAGINITLYGDTPHTIRARSIDAAGNIGGFSPDRHLIMAANAPYVASTTPPANGTTGPSANIVAHYFDPDGPPLATCSISVKNRLGSLVAGSASLSGLDCIFTPASGALNEGGNPYTATTQATDPPGNISPVVSWQFTVDTTPPPAPVISTPAEGAHVSSLNVTVGGTAENGSTVQVFEGLTFLGSAPASPAWSLVLPFSEAPHTIRAIAADGAGNFGPFSANRSFIVDVTAPAAPVITSPAPASTVAGGTPVTGTAESGTIVTLHEGLTYLGQSPANPTWSIVPTLSDGPHTVTARAIDVAGNTSAGSSLTYTIDSTAPTQPVITAPANGAFLNSSSVVVSGFADVGTTVIVREGLAMIGTPQIASPAWSVSGFFSEATHTLTATSTDAVGNASTPASVSFTVDLHAPAAPTITAPAAGSLQGATVTVAGGGERLATVEVWEGVSLLGSTVASSSGNWTIDLPFGDGSHTIRARQIDPAGNVGPYSGTVTFTVDTLAPPAPVITDPSSGSTQPRGVLIKGTAEAGASLTVFEGTSTLGTTFVSGSGTWQISVSMIDGSHSVAARATDPAGNVGPYSALRSFNVDGGSPFVAITTADPSVFLQTPVFTGSVVDPIAGTNPGSGVINVQVRIFNLLSPNLTAPVVQTGTATCTPSCGVGVTNASWTYSAAPLAPGLYRFEAVATDAVGNVSNTASIRYVSVS